MIVRDSSRTLEPCLGSIAPWVDEMVVVDTGSKDDTPDIARRLGAKVYDFPWCDDFSAARNESLRHAHGQWLFWMDSDDTIEPPSGSGIRDLANRPLEDSPTAFILQVHCPGPEGSGDVTVVDHVKLFRNDPRLRFEGRIHEQILPAIRRINGEIRWTDFYVTHSGSEHSTEARRRKQERDLRLLQLEASEHPDHPFVQFNLGMTYLDMGQPGRALVRLRKCLDVSPREESHVRKAYALLANCLVELDRIDEARDVIADGLSHYLGDAELLFRLGVVEQRGGNTEAAVEAFEAAIRDHGERRFSSRDRGITGYKARHNLGCIYRDSGQLDMAELQWRLALSDEPSFLPAWQGLVEALLGQHKLATLEFEIEHAATAKAVSSAELALARARLLAARGNPSEAIRLLVPASTWSADERVGALRQRCQLLFQHASLSEAIDSLEELCRTAPDDAAAWHNLGTAYQRAGRLETAIQHYERSLALRPDSTATQTQLDQARRELGQAIRPGTGPSNSSHTSAKPLASIAS